MKKYLLDKLLFMQVFAVSCGLIQGREKDGEELSVRLGESAVLKCQADPSKQNKTVWRRKDGVIFLGFSLSPAFNKTQKYNIEGNQRNREFFLKIHDIDETDIQSYWCETQTKESSDVIQNKITLVLQPFTTSHTTRDLTSTDGNDVTEKDQSQTTYIVFQSTNNPDDADRLPAVVVYIIVCAILVFVFVVLSCLSVYWKNVF